MFEQQVNLKYDAWQKELQGSFATILAEETRQVSVSRGSHACIGRRGPTLPLSLRTQASRAVLLLLESPTSRDNLGVTLFAFCVATHRADRVSIHVATLKVRFFHAEPFVQSASCAVIPLFPRSSIALARSVRRYKNINVAAFPVAASVLRVPPLWHLPAWRGCCLSRLGLFQADRSPDNPSWSHSSAYC